MRLLCVLFSVTPLLTIASCVPADDGAGPAESSELAQASAACEPVLPAGSRADLAHTLDGVVATGASPGVTITVDHPAFRRFSAAAGVADLATGEPIEPGHRIRAGSMLKVAVATAVLQLVERGKLSLDARLTQVLPRAITSRVAEAAAITVRMLLSHTAGVPEFSDEAFHEAVFEDPARVWTTRDYLALSAAQPRAFAPGAGWSYSNTNYILLGEIVTVVSGAPWRTTVKQRVLRRAGLDDSALPQPGNPRCHGCARGYELRGGALVDLTEVDPSMADAAGGGALVTTSADLARFLRALLAGELFDRPSTLSLMKSFVDAPLPHEAQTHYGLGLARLEFGGRELLGHIGNTAGYGGFMLLDTASGVVFTGGMNQRGNLGAFIIPVIQAVGRLP